MKGIKVMFLYWDGFEIDGSDTDFNIVLPENVQLCEFVDCFLTVPLFDKNMEPEFSYFENREKANISYDELKKRILSGEYISLDISINCCHIEELSANLYKEIYSISERRFPHEDAYGKVVNPCTEPKKQDYYERGQMTVNLRIGKGKFDNSEDYELDGYVTNIELLISDNVVLPYVCVNVGPSFYFEYAMYIVDYLRDKFPSIATFGGLDCENGWTDGCTYANSIYGFEKITIPVQFDIKKTIKQLSDYKILCPIIKYFTNEFICEKTQDFYLTRKIPSFIRSIENLEHLSYDDYINHIESVLITSKTAFKTICETAVEIFIPKPDEFNTDKKVYKKLNTAFNEAFSNITDSNKNTDWYLMGYFCVSDKKIVEFRINYRMKKYFMMLIDLMKSGEIEFIKQLSDKSLRDE